MEVTKPGMRWGGWGAKRSMTKQPQAASSSGVHALSQAPSAKLALEMSGASGARGKG